MSFDMSIRDSRSSGAPVIWLLQIPHLLMSILISLSARAALSFQIILIVFVNNIFVDLEAG